ncbi:hypothetical protein BH18ACT3_BH18ACT3_07170 [soil metagenome]
MTGERSALKSHCNALAGGPSAIPAVRAELVGTERVGRATHHSKGHTSPLTQAAGVHHPV